MYRYSKSLNERSRKLLTSALVQCHFDYAASAWFMGSTKALKDKLQVAQNKMVRFILDMGPREHIGQNELDRLGMNNTGNRVRQLMVNHMYKVYNGTAPCYLTEMFTKVQDQHQYVTRNSQYNFVIPIVNGMGMGSFAYQGSKVWNSLPNEIKASPNKHRFKTAVKKYFSNVSHAAEQHVYIQ